MVEVVLVLVDLLYTSDADWVREICLLWIEGEMRTEIASQLRPSYTKRDAQALVDGKPVTE